MVRVSNYVLVTVLVCMCVVRLPFGPFVRFSFQMVVECGVMLMFAWIIGRRNRWAGLLLALVVASSAIHNDIFSYLTCRTVLIGFVWYWIVSNHYSEKILDGLCVVAMANVLMLALQAFNIDPLYAPVSGGKEELVGLMSNQNEVSALLAVCAFAFLREARWFGLVAVVGGLVLARSFGGALAAGAGMSLFLILRGHRFLGAALPAAGLLMFLIIDAPTVHERVAAWTVGTEQYLAHWVSGFGVGHWQIEFMHNPDPRLGPKVWQYAHNEYLQGLFEMGPLFLVFVTGYAVNIIRRTAMLYRTIPLNLLKGLHPYLAGAFAVAVNSGVNFLFHIGPTAIIAVTVLAGLEYKMRELEA